jgi:DNA-binding HxlR family transcriptional regulator
MRIRYGQFCPIAKAAEVLGERWTILIMRELVLGSTRFTELQRALSRISPSLLTKRLNELRDCGLIVQKKLPEQQRTEYHVTAAGRDLLPVLTSLGKWGMKWARGQMTDDELDVELLMFDLSRRIDRNQLPGGRHIIHVAFTGLTQFANWWIVLEETGERELCLINPGKEVDLRICSDVRTLTEIWAGDTAMRTAKATGRWQVTGNPLLIRTMPSWLRIGMFADVRPHRDRLNN